MDIVKIEASTYQNYRFTYIIIGWIATIIAPTYTFQGTFKYIKEQLYTSMLVFVYWCTNQYLVVLFCTLLYSCVRQGTEMGPDAQKRTLGIN